MTYIADVIVDPGYFLHRIDPAAGTATFVPTTAEALAAPSFVDGRSDFSCGPAVDIPLDVLLCADAPTVPGPNRMIFHVAFCGSTLLARMLEHRDAAFVLKEPNVLVDIANWKTAGSDARFEPTLRMALACLRRRWSADEVVVVKPSNWVNNLLGNLAEDAAGLRAVFVTMDPRAYATAVLRGGRDRLAFAARTASHLAASVPQGADWLHAAIAATADPIGRAVNLALVALSIQTRLFDDRAGAVLDFETITHHPAEAAFQASEALDLGLDRDRIEDLAASRAGTDAKRPGHIFSPDVRHEEDAEVARFHRATIDAAMDWSSHMLA